jgi:CheY-like chemotaxis protein
MRTNPLVLLVDDEEVFLEIASVKLRAEGLETIMTQDFRDALEKAERLLPDLVLSDIYMPPGPSGWELALELRRNPKTREIKIAFFTSLRDPWMELRRERKAAVAAELGKVTFLSKTDDVEVLAERVMDLIGRSVNEK